ncbi:MAG TPA: PilZ domain-containing protein [Myxococcales bacterium]|nr:PilZ domain-containing protein [Myxococcales bacterium]
MAPQSIPIVLPVRFSGGGLSMQTTTSRLSAGSVFVRSMVSPKEGARVELLLTLPGAPAPVKIDGSVTERAGGPESGFTAKFDALSPEANKHLSALLQSHGVAAPPDKRTFERVRTRIQVGWSSPKEFLVAYSENISRGGIFVATRRPPELREVVELLLELPDGQPPAKTLAAVVQRVTEEQAAAGKRVAGAGLQFVGGDDEFRKRLDTCIEHLLAPGT